MEDVTALQNGKIGKGLKKFLTDEVVGKGKGKESLLVIDPHLCLYLQFFTHQTGFLTTRFLVARSISKKFSFSVSATSEEQGELWRGIRSQITALLQGLDPKDLATMSLGLSHSLSRYAGIIAFPVNALFLKQRRFKLKFSPDKVDTMVVQAIALLDDLDKEINTYAMRVKVGFLVYQQTTY